MNIAIVGTGYVGLVSGACFAEMGNYVVCVDKDKQKIQRLLGGEIPIYEPGLEEMVKKSSSEGNLVFTTCLQEALQGNSSVRACEILFIAVGTPMGEDGSADLRHVLDVAREIGRLLKYPLIIVDKSTVPVGTAHKVKETIQQELDKRGVEVTFSVLSNPEFLKEGDAINDFLRPDRVVVGGDDTHSMEVLRELYAPFVRTHDRFIYMDIKSAEMTKYAANAMLATKISFMNEIGRICEAVGANVNAVRIGIGSDKRIGYSFIYPGCGYGGSCFPKDVQALIKTAKDFGVDTALISATQSVNASQKRVLGDKILKHFNGLLENKTFAIWGLSFKPETDDMREASSLVLIGMILAHGGSVCVYDPKAMEEAQKFYFTQKNLENIIHSLDLQTFNKDLSSIYTKITYAKNKYDCLNQADAMILVTEWKEFRSPDFYEIKERLKQPLIFDGRNQFNAKRLKELGFTYYEIGVATAL